MMPAGVKRRGVVGALSVVVCWVMRHPRGGACVRVCLGSVGNEQRERYVIASRVSTGKRQVPRDTLKAARALTVQLARRCAATRYAKSKAPKFARAVGDGRLDECQIIAPVERVRSPEGLASLESRKTVFDSLDSPDSLDS